MGTIRITYPRPNSVKLLDDDVTPCHDATYRRCYCGRPRRPRKDGTVPTYCSQHD